MKKVAEHDEEGRLIMLEFDTFFLLNVYASLLLLQLASTIVSVHHVYGALSVWTNLALLQTPNAGEGLKRLGYKARLLSSEQFQGRVRQC